MTGCSVLILMATATALDGSAQVLGHAKDYTYMWWAHGLRDSRRVIGVQTSRYGLSFDTNAFALRTFGPLAEPLPEEDALAASNDAVFALPSATLECVLVAGGQRFAAVGMGEGWEPAKIVESGKWFQRRWLDGVRFAPGAPPVTGRLEWAAWPDRLAFVLHLTPDGPITDATLSLTLSLAPAYADLVQEASALALVSAEDSGYVALPGSAGATLAADAAARTLTVAAPAAIPWPTGETRSVGLVVYPVARGARKAAPFIARQEAEPVAATARQLAPRAAELAVDYDPVYGWHRVALRNDGSGNDRFEQVELTLDNPASRSRTVRLLLAKEDRVFGVTGLSAMLGDESGVPLGLPVQLSKNWHGWVWYHGFAMLTVPPRTRLVLRYTSVNAHWGGVAAASHAQLCLIGWGGHQQWDEAAIGSWGESICFDPDVGLRRAMIDDVRPLMVWTMNQPEPKQWGWTNNVGGGDFLVYVDAQGARQWNSRMRSQYRRYGPCLTEVTYAGQSHDAAIEVHCTVSLYRTDDINRGVYRLRYDVRQPVRFQRLALFQLGADQYNDHQFVKIARGNEDGLLEEWTTERGGRRYLRTGLPCPGRVPWVSLHEAVSRDTSAGAWANRGMVVRHWNARIGGQEAPAPFLAVYGTEDQFASALVELSLPPGTTQLLPGDFVEAEVVQVTVPQFAADYYGPNEGLRRALAQHENTWGMILREAVGNDLVVEATTGTVERAYPVRIRAGTDGTAAFSIRGGLGYVPLTIAGVPDYRAPLLERWFDSAWQPVDQSVHGNDYWQTDYDPQTQTWEITYTVPLDRADDVPVRQAFRFRAGAR